jgi:hypothetical protein
MGCNDNNFGFCVMHRLFGLYWSVRRGGSAEMRGEEGVGQTLSFQHRQFQAKTGDLEQQAVNIMMKYVTLSIVIRALLNVLSQPC